jgi:predicted transcriptional regulator
MVMVASMAKTPHVIRTVRIPEALDKALRKVAEERNTSVNALIEASLAKFIEFDQYVEELDYGMVRKMFLVRGLEYLSEDEIRELARWSAMELGSETLRFYNAYPKLDAVLHTYESIIAKYGRLYTFRHEVEGRNHTIFLSHRMGKNWSIFFEENLKTIFGRLGIDLETETSTNLVRGRFVEKSTAPSSIGPRKAG